MTSRRRVSHAKFALLFSTLVSIFQVPQPVVLMIKLQSIPKTDTSFRVFVSLVNITKKRDKEHFLSFWFHCPNRGSGCWHWALLTMTIKPAHPLSLFGVRGAISVGPFNVIMSILARRWPHYKQILVCNYVCLFLSLSLSLRRPSPFCGAKSKETHIGNCLFVACQTSGDTNKHCVDQTLMASH